ncbi:hypothetical protein CHS0354_030923 [Potamilus streckersoni]|uniref:Uncharacterized protein n=1 Tax=Potamilus streckersoni TaxID=2493646 RepID=A0AAE0RV05_9BIVA|nr:hypothetical protein CHS0354_030923 [Potamilus streckersoni]
MASGKIVLSAMLMVNDFDGFHSEHEIETIQEKIVKLAKDLSLECEMEDVKELLDKESGELTNEELIELEEERVAEEERREAEKEEEELESSPLRDYQKVYLY